MSAAPHPTPAWPQRLIAALDGADRRARDVAGALTPVQLNWQPRPGSWSVGQCLEHLTKGNELMISAMSEALAGRESGTADEIHLGRISAWFIRQYIAPNPKVRARAPGKIQPQAEVNATALDSFLSANQSAREIIARASSYDVNRIRYVNPFIPLVRFTVGTGLEIIAQHELRHLEQAERVRAAAGFPA